MPNIHIEMRDSMFYATLGEQACEDMGMNFDEHNNYLATVPIVVDAKERSGNDGNNELSTWKSERDMEWDKAWKRVTPPIRRTADDGFPATCLGCSREGEYELEQVAMPIVRGKEGA
jgi:hypothetical protein